MASSTGKKQRIADYRKRKSAASNRAPRINANAGLGFNGQPIATTTPF